MHHACVNNLYYLVLADPKSLPLSKFFVLFYMVAEEKLHQVSSIIIYHVLKYYRIVISDP